MLPLCVSEGIGVIPWSPLARGRLTRPWEETPSTERAATDEVGKAFYAKTMEADHQVVDRVTEISRERGLPQAQIALAWVLQKPGVSAPIVGATKPHQLEDAIAAVSVKLSADEVARLEEPYLPHMVSGHQ